MHIFVLKQGKVEELNAQISSLEHTIEFLTKMNVESKSYLLYCALFQNAKSYNVFDKL